jgi:signal transduction histidine kinase
MIYPVIYNGKPEGVLIFSMVKDENKVSEDERDLIRSFTDVVGLAVQDAKLYTSLQDKTQELAIVNGDLKQANSKLQELDKLKDEFVSLASHELRTPMTAIKGSISTILDGYAGEVSKESREFLTAAYNENDRLIRLVNNLLNISRIEAGRFTFSVIHIDMNKLAAGVVGNLEMAAKEKGLYLKVDAFAGPAVVLGDEDKVKEVLINLIGNALKFTHKGGVTVNMKLDGKMLVTSVSDTGSGIAKEDQDLLFKKFSQVQGSYAKQTGGTGLGLYISKQIVEGLKGTIWLESKLGQGSSFKFSLPIASS